MPRRSRTRHFGHRPIARLQGRPGTLDGIRRACRALFLGFTVSVSPMAVAVVHACQICIELPKDSVADRIIDADLVVLLREDPAQPFRFSVHRRLSGTATGMPPPPFLVDTVMRARLAANPDEGALATWTASDGWALHGHMTTDFQDVVTGIIAASGGWTGPEGMKSRFDFFAPLHASPDPAVQELALVELARMPYVLLQGLQPGIDSRQVVARLVDPQLLEWGPVYILILGQSDDSGDRNFVRHAAEAALRTGSGRHLAAWTTALIEIDGVPAIELILRDHLTGDVFPDAGVRAVALGLSEHAAGNDPIVASEALSALKTTAALYPAAAGIAARTLLGAGDWSAAATMASLLDGGMVLAPDDRFIVEAYLAAAQDASADPTALAKATPQD